ncbi:type IV toxin-antitoxin system AbiEi family antitoxin domain-containing protein [Sharpea azabuensis]|uniref:type IV toxin-antitoxin system AbiEi family antitoxin domain-containing protein n=1 Tax=Sharpea azabuensis TaxID=322505 RepID=UPI003B75B373
MIDFAKHHQTFTRKDIQKTFGFSQTTCIRLLSHLVEKGKIIKEGQSRNIHYQLVR